MANSNGDKRWRYLREKIMFFFGLSLITAEFLNAEVRGGNFHFEFLLGGLALCGIAIAGYGDRSGK